MTAPFGDLVGSLDYPMFIVTTAAGEERAGCLVGFAAQCSIDPPLFTVWLSDKNHTCRVAARASTLVVHLPSLGDRQLGELFGSETGDEVDKFARCDWHVGPDGVPVLDAVPRWFAGRIIGRTPTGDHVAHLLEPTEASTDGDDGWRQLNFQSIKDLDPGHEA